VEAISLAGIAPVEGATLVTAGGGNLISNSLTDRQSLEPMTEQLPVVGVTDNKHLEIQLAIHRAVDIRLVDNRFGILNSLTDMYSNTSPVCFVCQLVFQQVF
jgi:hypothetical protein